MFKHFLEIPVKYSKWRPPFLEVYISVIKRDTNIPQNKLKVIPNICVVAKPNTGLNQKQTR
jgi:hypothetical protein